MHASGEPRAARGPNISPRRRSHPIFRATEWRNRLLRARVVQLVYSIRKRLIMEEVDEYVLPGKRFANLVPASNSWTVT